MIYCVMRSKRQKISVNMEVSKSTERNTTEIYKKSNSFKVIMNLIYNGLLEIIIVTPKC